MKTTLARKQFKVRFGQANHFLITALVGIDGIESGIISKKPDSFSTIWNPQDKRNSAIRTRGFILKSFLGWVVESLEMYLTLLNRKPKLLNTEKFTQLFSKAGQSVYLKTILIGDEIKVNPVLIALMEVLITWRNYTFHYDIDNEIRDSSMEILQREHELINQKFCGLEINELKKTWENKGDFTFKETASLINATQLYVTEIDKYILQNLDYERYYTETLILHFKNNPNTLHRFYSASTKRKKYIKVLMQNIIGETEFSDTYLDLLIENVYKEFKK